MPTVSAIVGESDLNGAGGRFLVDSMISTLATLITAIAGFSGPIVINLAGLFIVSESLDATGITAQAGQRRTKRVGDTRCRPPCMLTVAPIAVTIVQSAQVSPLPTMMAFTFAGEALLMTPVATPGNLMVQESGGYRFSDYWKLERPCLLRFGLVAVFVMSLVWLF